MFFKSVFVALALLQVSCNFCEAESVPPFQTDPACAPPPSAKKKKKKKRKFDDDDLSLFLVRYVGTRLSVLKLCSIALKPSQRMLITFFLQ